MPGGFVAPIGEREKTEIRRRWPNLSLERLESAWAEYQVRLQSPPTQPRVIRESLEGIVRLSADLRVCLATLSEEAEDRLWFTLYEQQRHTLLREMPAYLTLLLGAAKLGFNEELGRDGRYLHGPNRRLFELLRQTLEQGGYTGRSMNGDIARLAEILLDGAGVERPKDLPRAVRETFESGGHTPQKAE